jgi:uncharacterized protein (TIGR00299 family) protein
MRIAVFDAWAGVAGDMWVGALLDAGAPLAALADAVASLGLPGVSLRTERVLRCGLSGLRFLVDEGGMPAEQFVPLAPAGSLLQVGGGGHVHRGLREIEAIVQRAALPEPVRAQCLAVYRAIGEVEAAAHGVALEQVHFHEVGAVDTIVDVVCACLAVHLLGIERIVANGIEVGSGTVRAAHGVLPVPAPATEALLRGIPVRRGGLPGERTTPTGAALLKVLCAAFDQPVAMTVRSVGYGAGTRDDALAPNLLRVAVGDTVAASSPTAVVELQCQIDTATGEQLGWLLDELLRRGAVDAFVTPVQMKKGRPGVLVTVLAEPARAVELRTLLLAEAGTLGVREQRVDRHVLERWQETRETPFGPLRFKVARLPGGEVLARPESDDLQRICAEFHLGRQEVLRRLGATLG